MFKSELLRALAVSHDFDREDVWELFRHWKERDVNLPDLRAAFQYLAQPKGNSETFFTLIRRSLCQGFFGMIADLGHTIGDPTGAQAFFQRLASQAAVECVGATAGELVYRLQISQMLCREVAELTLLATAPDNSDGH